MGILVAGALAFLLGVEPASAMGLGAASLNSGLGEPLRLSFPVSAKGDEDVGCVQVRARGDDLPGVLNTRVSVIRNAFQTRIEIRSIQPVNEPAIGLVVSVGCASPIAREYVVFLDPPVVPALAGEPEEAGVTAGPAPRRPARPAPSTRASGPADRVGAASSRATAPAGARASRARRAAPSATATPPLASPSAVPAPPPAPAAVAPGRDRLTVAPSEAPTGASGAPPAAPATSASPSGAASGTVGASGPAASPATGPSAAALPGTTPVPDAEAAAREQALRQQQAELQRQIQALGDQIAALRIQTTQLATRNRALEQNAFPDWLVWLLVALAALATLVAGWLAWRYLQLKRSLDGSPWWGGSSVLAPVDRATTSTTSSGVASLDAGTRLVPRGAAPGEVRASPSVPATTTATNAPERSRPTARETRYPAAIDTDFTVSDIEAAMATVRTVSPPRAAPRPAKPEDSDLGALGGPTLPSPFTEPPAPPPRAGKAIERDGDDLGQFVDLDIPPLDVPPARPAFAAPAPVSSPKAPPPPPSVNVKSNAVADDPIEPLDFKLDAPPYDPLATDSLKTTIVDRENAAAAPPPGALLDFELSTTSVLPSQADLDVFAGEPPVRHGATALDDLFASRTEAGIDTILDLDDRHGGPLSTTEVDRLTTTAVEGPQGEIAPASTRSRLSRFADLMNQVDEVAEADPLRAIALLRQYVLRDEGIPTVLWLRLFALYKVVDKRPVYEALAEHFARRYQRPMIGWDEELADRVPQAPLSAMGRIDREIEASWGKPEGLERMRALLCGRDQDDAIVFNLVLQRDLLDAAKVFPLSDEAGQPPAL